MKKYVTSLLVLLNFDVPVSFLWYLPKIIRVERENTKYFNRGSFDDGTVLLCPLATNHHCNPFWWDFLINKKMILVLFTSRNENFILTNSRAPFYSLLSIMLFWVSSIFLVTFLLNVLLETTPDNYTNLYVQVSHISFPLVLLTEWYNLCPCSFSLMIGWRAFF